MIENNQIQPPPFVDSPVIVRRPTRVSSSHRRSPWMPILIVAVAAAFVAGWIASQSPLSSVIPAAVTYTLEQRAVLQWINENEGDPNIEIIKFEGPISHLPTLEPWDEWAKRHDVHESEFEYKRQQYNEAKLYYANLKPTIYVRLKYRGDGIFGGKDVWDRLFEIVDGKAVMREWNYSDSRWERLAKQN